MTQKQFEAISEFRAKYKKKCREWSGFTDLLVPLQEEAAKKDTPFYPVQTPVVYNRALDEITMTDQINFIVIGDNPGKDEQLEKNNRYLVGQSGKIAEGFFRKHSALRSDFRKNAIILNKTPVHTAKTLHLKYLAKNSAEAAELILQSQVWLAYETARLHQALGCELWLVGYAELKPKGIFIPYKDALFEAYKNAGSSWARVFVYQHFSMNRFLIDLKEFAGAKSVYAIDENALKPLLEKLGARHRDEIFANLAG